MISLHRQKLHRMAFSGVYFLYFCGYSIFASFLVPYLVECGYNGAWCGTVTSLSLVVSLLVQPAAGYITDSRIPLRNYLILSIAAIFFLSIVGQRGIRQPIGCLIICTTLAAFAYPFGQLLDAWTDEIHKTEELVVYSRIRAWGSLGYALTSIWFGWMVSRAGYNGYFGIQAMIFCSILPLLLLLPFALPNNSKESLSTGKEPLLFTASFSILLKKKNYRLLLILFTLYWMSHRPIGSYLALIVRERGGSDGLYGAVCAAGAATECLILFASVRFMKHFSSKGMMSAVLVIGLLRPGLMLLSKSVSILFAAQIIQSMAFAIFYPVSVQAFSDAGDGRIHNFSVAAGLTTTSVIGTASANLLSGKCCDLFGAESVIWLSAGFCIANIVFYSYVKGAMFSSNDSCVRLV